MLMSTNSMPSLEIYALLCIISYGVSRRHLVAIQFVILALEVVLKTSTKCVVQQLKPSADHIKVGWTSYR